MLKVKLKIDSIFQNRLFSDARNEMDSSAMKLGRDNQNDWSLRPVRKKGKYDRVGRIEIQLYTFLSRHMTPHFVIEFFIFPGESDVGIEEEATPWQLITAFCVSRTVASVTVFSQPNCLRPSHFLSHRLSPLCNQIKATRSEHFLGTILALSFYGLRLRFPALAFFPC